MSSQTEDRTQNQWSQEDLKYLNKRNQKQTVLHFLIHISLDPRLYLEMRDQLKKIHKIFLPPVS